MADENDSRENIERLNSRARLFKCLFPECSPYSDHVVSYYITPSLFQERLGTLVKKEGWGKASKTILGFLLDTKLDIGVIDEMLQFVMSKGMKTAEPFLVRLLRKDHFNVAGQLALQRLATFKSKVAFEMLIELASEDSGDSFSRAIAIRLLANYKDDRSADCIGKVLGSGNLRDLDEARKNESARWITKEWDCVESLVTIGTDRAAQHLCIVHVQSPSCITVKEAVVKMPDKAVPYLLRITVETNEPRWCKAAANLIVELGHGQNSLSLLNARFMSKEGEPGTIRQGIINASNALRAAMISNPGCARQSGTLPEMPELKRFPVKNPRKEPGSGIVPGAGKKALL